MHLLKHEKTSINLEWRHKVRIYIYKVYNSVCPLVGIGTLPNPLSPAGEGVGGVPIPTTGEKLSTLPTL